MSHEDANRDERRRGPMRRWLWKAALAAYLLTFALAPRWATFGFLDKPMLGQTPEVESREGARYQPVSWEVLAGFPYEFDMPEALEDASPLALAERNERLLPLEVRALDGHPIAVRGYVIPVAFADGRVTEFVLAAKNEIGCCFGDGLSMNQWIQVAVPKYASFDLEPLAIATVEGLLEVGEEVRGGVVLSLYRMRNATVRAG